MNDFRKYEQMRDDGLSATVVYTTAKADGADPIACIRILRNVFQFSLIEAKEAIVIAEQLGTSLAEYQGKLKGDIAQVLKEEISVDDNTTP